MVLKSTDAGEPIAIAAKIELERLFIIALRIRSSEQTKSSPELKYSQRDAFSNLSILRMSQVDTKK